METLKLTVEHGQERIDKYLSEKCPDYTRSYFQKLIEGGSVTVNGKSVKPKYLVKNGDRIEVLVPDAVEIKLEPEEIPLDIVYEDNYLLVVNKPRGMIVHPAAGNYSGTLVNAVLSHCKGRLSGINGELRPGIVHRIDKDTTGLIVIAKDNNAHQKLSEQLKDRSLFREYEAIVHGNIKEDAGTISAPIARHRTDRKKMAVTNINSKEAITNFQVLERFGSYTYVKCTLKTGRTHQIRVHMKYLGHPIVGDKTYGIKREEFCTEGQLLHARRCGFVHPVTGEKMFFECPLPEDFQKILDILRKKIK